MDGNRVVLALVKQAQDAVGRDWSQAATLAAELRNLFPDHPAGYQIGASSARALGRFGDATALIVEGASRFPEAIWPSGEMAWTARARGDNQEALRLAAELRDRFPNDADGYHLGAICSRALGLLDQAADIATRAQARFPALAWPIVEMAWIAHAKGNHEEAIRLAAELREWFPDNAAGYQVAVISARALGRFEGIGAILAEAQARFPTQTWPVIEMAWVARARGEHGDAASLAAELRASLPDDPVGYQVGAISLRALGRFDDAAAILSEAGARFPTHAWPLAEMASTARARGDDQEAMRLAAQLRERFPGDPAGYQTGAASARALGLLDEATTILSDARMRFPTHAWPLVDLASAAKAAGDTDAAIRFATELRERFPTELAGYQIGATGARELGRFDEAAAILRDGMARFPTALWPWTELVLTARASGDTDGAIELAGELRVRFPDNPTGYQIGATFLRVRNRLDEAEAVLREALERFPGQSWAEHDAAETARMRVNRTGAAHLVDKLQGPAGTILMQGGRPRPTGGKVVVVLGMHRAGTSLCTRIVQQLGIGLGGPLLTADFDNPDGYQEHKAIVDCHRSLLEALHVEWDTIRSIQPASAAFWESETAAATRDRLKQIVAGQVKAVGGVWAFKDPRTTGFIPLWKDVFNDLDIEPVWLLSVRDPRAVAASLFTRNRLPVALGELLWLEHYLDALRHLGSEIAGIVHYERWFPAPIAQVRDVARMIGGAAEDVVERAASSVRAELRHNRSDQHTFNLDLTRQLHAWLLADRPDLTRLQLEATTMWRGLAAVGRDCVADPEQTSSQMPDPS